MTFEVTRAIRADHPSLPGHFPGTPLVPGVVILDEIVAALAEWRRRLSAYRHTNGQVSRAARSLSSRSPSVFPRVMALRAKSIFPAASKTA